MGPSFSCFCVHRPDRRHLDLLPACLPTLTKKKKNSGEARRENSSRSSSLQSAHSRRPSLQREPQQQQQRQRPRPGTLKALLDLELVWNRQRGGKGSLRVGQVTDARAGMDSQVRTVGVGRGVASGVGVPFWRMLGVNIFVRFVQKIDASRKGKSWGVPFFSFFFFCCVFLCTAVLLHVFNEERVVTIRVFFPA